MGSVIDHVLSIEEVRQGMKAVTEAALHQGAVIHYGERGADQLVIMSRELWEAVLAERPRAAAECPGPYAAFSRAVAEGRLGQGSEEAKPAARPRRATDLNETSTIPLAQMVQMGHDISAPARRRPAAPASTASQA